MDNKEMSKESNIKDTTKSNLVRPKMLEVTTFLEKFSLEDTVNKLGELIDGGDSVIAAASFGLTRDILKTYPQYYYEVQDYYVKWKSQCRDFFKAMGSGFQDECEVFRESDIVPYPYYVERFDEVRSAERDQMLRDVVVEAKRKLAILREVRKRLEKLFHREPAYGSVNKLEIVTPLDEEVEYILIVNGVFEKPITQRRTPKSSGRLLLDLSEKGQAKEGVRIESYADQVDKYWNSSKENPIYKKNGYKLTKIIQRKEGNYLCVVTLRRIARDTYKKKKK